MKETYTKEQNLLRQQEQTYFRLLAVPFWIVERAREPKTHSAARLERSKAPPLVHSNFQLGYFARPLDYPDKGLLAV